MRFIGLTGRLVYRSVGSVRVAGGFFLVSFFYLREGRYCSGVVVIERRSVDV